MPRPVPIEVDLNTWLIMRTNPTQPSALVERVTHENGITRYMLFTWSSNPTARRLIGVFDSLDAANEDVPHSESRGSRDDGRGGWPPGAHDPMPV
ncbi:hypothetical protein [Leucobacter sp.]